MDARTKIDSHSPPGSSPHLQFGEVALRSRLSQYPEKQGRKDQKSENQPDDHGYFTVVPSTGSLSVSLTGQSVFYAGYRTCNQQDAHPGENVIEGYHSPGPEKEQQASEP